MVASDSTVHLFRDETEQPVPYPVLQNVLLSTRKSLAWNPEYWYTQPGDHRYRMALLPHQGNWRARYRDAIAFNYRLTAFVKKEEDCGHEPIPFSNQCIALEPQNLILTAMKKAEADNSIVVRFYEAEGNDCTARIKLAQPIRRAMRTSLIEEDQEPIETLADGSVELHVGAWEIATIRLLV